MNRGTHRITFITVLILFLSNYTGDLNYRTECQGNNKVKESGSNG